MIVASGCASRCVLSGYLLELVNAAATGDDRVASGLQLEAECQADAARTAGMKMVFAEMFMFSSRLLSATA
jgi:hypothetical protein